MSPDETALSGDERWELVQRIVESSGFQRSAQLRAILQYVSRFAILHPGQPLREYDIALDVLERRPDFDPAYDNIVRVQASHLRRRLDQYFEQEGMSEPMVVTLPKGTYVPQFRAPSTKPSAIADSDMRDTPIPSEGVRVSRETGAGQLRQRLILFLAMAASAVIGVLLTLWITKPRSDPAPKRSVSTNLILRPLIERGGPVSVVLPDIGFMEIENLLKLDVKIPEYTSSNFPDQFLRTLKDPQLRQALMYVGQKRGTSIGSAYIMVDILQELQAEGVHASIRYARDLHVRDLGEGNLILIGSQRTNPWVSLFLGRTNFTYFEDDQGHYFVNANPRQGELPKYFSSQPADNAEEQVSYVDVALLPNLTNSGYVLLLNGADVQANEAAANFLLHGKLPPLVENALSNQRPMGFELFLRGKHLRDEADDTFEIVAYRLAGD